jgi:hypothetical protein
MFEFSAVTHGAASPRFRADTLLPAACECHILPPIANYQTPPALCRRRRRDARLTLSAMPLYAMPLCSAP